MSTISTNNLPANTDANRHDIHNLMFMYKPTEIDKFSTNSKMRCYDEHERVNYTQDSDKEDLDSDKEGSDSDKDEDENKNKNDETPTDIIKNCLLGVKQTGFFSCGGSIDGAVPPRLYIDGIGDIGLPLSKEQAQLVISKCQMAPFGRKEETILDTNVRHTWQMEPSQFTIKNPRWDIMIKDLVKQVCDKLVCDLEKVNHVLYKLLIYEPGSFFKPHCDSEKEEGMFGTMVVVLPSPYSGGQLVIRHNGEVCEYDFGDRSDLLETTFTAFYADCEHEIKPVMTGTRICLVYNLVNIGTDIAPSIKDDTDTLQKLINAINDWIANPDDCPGLLVYGLEHHYTDAGLSFSGLKGKDVAIARMLKTVSERVPLNLYLVNMEREVSLSEDFGNTECTTITTWVSATGQNDPEVEIIPIRQKYMVQKNFWKDKTKDKVEAKLMGNQAADISRFYHHAGIVFWPPQIKHHKYIGKSLSKVVKYMKALKEESDIREAALLIIRKLKNFTDLNEYCKENFIYDLYEILFRYNLSDQATELAHFVADFKSPFREYANHIDGRNIDAVKKLNETYPTLSTNPAFHTLVTSVKRKLDLEIENDAKAPKRMRTNWEDDKINKKKETVAEFEKILGIEHATETKNEMIGIEHATETKNKEEKDFIKIYQKLYGIKPY